MPISFTRVSDRSRPLARSPRHGRAVPVEEAQAGCALLREERIDHLRNRSLDAEGRVRSAQLRADPARRPSATIARGSSACGRIAPHILVERGLAAAIDLEAALGVVGDAALAGRHDPIRPVGGTRSSNPSTARITPSALVSITRTNSSVGTSAIVSVALRLAVPALTNNMSRALPASRSRNSAI